MKFIANLRARGVVVSIKTSPRHLGIFKQPHTFVKAAGLMRGRRGVQFWWNTDDEDTLRMVHHAVVGAMNRGMGLRELRVVADLGRHLMDQGQKSFPTHIPLPELLKGINGYIKDIR